ncbi:aldehyde dehydrogenase (NADP(+)) [Robiginitalea marina]|uniref:Aldehyde dehydrogenase (NADP(+)) n=1 Tax=Robiginitalea marina TaxID=2954105 RepID=A0ABT1B0M2_9FLAO|nr:aldehyde dehydrogenase (NADP(+)) [Robiginitalea marina]MCO5725390.1 aldehyde dehydrogenase (NADP(+)) [Robiginitalea marina]
MQEPITGEQLIGFSSSARGSDTFRTHNPKTGAPTPWSFREATREEAELAMALASKAHEAYQEVPGRRRAAFLRAIAGALEADAEILVPIYMEESGLPEGRARGELGRTVGQLRAFADLAAEGSWVEARIDTALPDRQPVARPDIRKYQVPLGPVVVFGASNFPFAFSTAGGDTASALAAGCPVVVKGHPLHAGTGEAVARRVGQAARETGMPEGVFSHLQGSGKDLGAWLVQHPLSRAVGFTGSREGGLALSRMGQERAEPIPVFAEMGSINPVVVLPSATDPGLGWAAAYAQSVTLGTGQFCTNPGLILGIVGEGWQQFTRSLAEAIARVPQGCMLQDSMAGRYRSMRSDFLAQRGVQELVPTSPGEGALVGATVAAVSGKDFIANPGLQREVFGPFTLTVSCSGPAELERAVRSLEGQLTASLLGEEAELQRFGTLLGLLRDRVGRLLLNGVPTGVEVCPSMQHGGPFPATTDARFTSVGTDAIRRWTRPLALQNAPASLLPPELRDDNPLGIWRLVNGTFTNQQGGT